MNSTVVVMIEYDDIVYDKNGNISSNMPRTIFLESVEDVSVDSRSELTAHPVVSGDMVADHMIKQPETMTIRGDFAINGSDNVLIDFSRPPLRAFQKRVENIKNNACLCTITKLVMNTNEVRFLQRDNMALTSISWVEKVSSLNFTFSFTKALTAEVQEYDVDLQDDNLPAVTDANMLSFSSTLMDWQQIDALVIDICSTEGLTTDEFMTMLKSYGAAYLAGSLAIGAAVLITYLAACASIPVGGWIVGLATIAIAGVAAIGYGLYSAIKSAINSRKYRIQQFKAYKDDRKNQQEVERFANFMGDIHTQLEQLNDAFYVYQITSDEPQECMLTIGGDYYTFKFDKNNTNNKWFVTITIPANNDEVVKANVSLDCAKSSYAECTSDNRLFRASVTGAYVYLIYIRNEDYDKNDLRNYYVLVSGIKPEDFANAITDIIKNAIMY